jgi:hypothetical protein
MVSIPNFHYKTDKTANIAICVPVRDQVTAVFTYSLAMLMKKCGEMGQSVSLHMNIGSEVAMQRQQLVDEVLSQTKCTHIMWIDSDMKFPTETISMLLSAKKPIVGANYSTRVKPHKPIAFKKESNLDVRVYTGTGLEEVFALGSGLMLVERGVYESMKKPYYGVEWNESFTNLVGEDIYFCKKAATYGHKTYVHHELSDRVSHIGTRAYTIKGDCYD